MSEHFTLGEKLFYFFSANKRCGDRRGGVMFYALDYSSPFFPNKEKETLYANVYPFNIFGLIFVVGWGAGPLFDP